MRSLSPEALPTTFAAAASSTIRTVSAYPTSPCSCTCAPATPRSVASGPTDAAKGSRPGKRSARWQGLLFWQVFSSWVRPPDYWFDVYEYDVARNESSKRLRCRLVPDSVLPPRTRLVTRFSSSCLRAATAATGTSAPTATATTCWSTRRRPINGERGRPGRRTGSTPQALPSTASSTCLAGQGTLDDSRRRTGLEPRGAIRATSRSGRSREQLLPTTGQAAPMPFAAVNESCAHGDSIYVFGPETDGGARGLGAQVRHCREQLVRNGANAGTFAPGRVVLRGRRSALHRGRGRRRRRRVRSLRPSDRSATDSQLARARARTLSLDERSGPRSMRAPSEWPPVALGSEQLISSAVGTPPRAAVQRTRRSRRDRRCWRLVRRVARASGEGGLSSNIPRRELPLGTRIFYPTPCGDRSGLPGPGNRRYTQTRAPRRIR